MKHPEPSIPTPTLNDVPSPFKDWITSDLDGWKLGTHTVITEDTAKNYNSQKFKYPLRMLWLGRFDELNKETIASLTYLSRRYLPEDLKDDLSKVRLGTTLFPEANHHQLAQLVFDETWKLYVNTKDIGHPFYKELKTKFNFKKLLGMK